MGVEPTTSWMPSDFQQPQPTNTYQKKQASHGKFLFPVSSFSQVIPADAGHKPDTAQVPSQREFS